MSILTFDNVSKIFYTKESQTVALDKLSFEINEGEFVALIGPSGCGKTTILSLVCGLIEPTSGRIIRGRQGGDASLDFSTREQARLVEMTYNNEQNRLDKMADGNKKKNSSKIADGNKKKSSSKIADEDEQNRLDKMADGNKKKSSSKIADGNKKKSSSKIADEDEQNRLNNMTYADEKDCLDKQNRENKRICLNKRDRLDKHDERASVGYMLQRDQLFEWRTIERNVTLGLEIQHKKTPENVEKARELLKKYGLWEFRKHFPQQLSGGMRQRVALIRTLATDPDLLLLDEPFSALDFQTRLDVCDDVYEIIKKENKTALLVTHDISEAIALADKIIVLTARPATVKDVHYTEMSDIDTPLHRRQSPDFSRQFEYLHNLLHNS